MLRLGTLVLLLTMIPATSFAWGAAAHRFIMGRAIELLPADIRPFFERHRAELVLRVNDPDTWRVVGWADDSNHFVNFGRSELGPYPFAALPREYSAALEKFGATGLARIGTLPWRQAEQFGNLRRAFESFRRNFAFAASDTTLFAAVASHYLQDAHMPLHASNNSDGQLTGQNGVHARFETALFERYETRLTIRPTPTAPVKDARDTAFETLLASHQLSSVLLQADKDAAGPTKRYDDQYFDRFFANARELLEQQITRSISATAALITGAWEAAGKPTVRVR